MKFSIARKLTIAFGIVLLLMAVLATVAIISLNRARVAAEQLIEIQEIVIAVDRATEKVFQERVALDSYFFTGNEQGKAQFELAYDDYTDAWAVVRNHRAEEYPDMLRTIEQQRTTNYNLYYNALLFHETSLGDLNRVMEQMGEADAYYKTKLGPSLQGIRELELNRAEQLSATTLRLHSIMLIVASVVSVLTIATAIFAAYRIGNGIQSAAVHLTSAAESISRGDLDVPIQVDTGDEMQRLGEAIDRMRISLKAAFERLRSR